MKIAVRRKVAVGCLITTAALVGGVVVAPNASAGTASVSPDFGVSTDSAKNVTFTASGTYATGGDYTFTRVGTPASTITGTLSTPSTAQPGSVLNMPTATLNLADGGSGLAVDGPADAGLYDLALVSSDPTGANDSCSSCFTVVKPGQLALASLSPNGQTQNSAANVTFKGDNFERSSTIDFLLPGQTVPDATIGGNAAPLAAGTLPGSGPAPVTNGITTRTQLKRRVTVSDSASTGPRDVRITNLDGSTVTCPACFTVQGAPLSKVTPSAGNNDPSANPSLTSLTFTGSGLSQGTPQLVFNGPSGGAPQSSLTITGTNAVFSPDSTTVTANYDLRYAAPTTGTTNNYIPQLMQSDTSTRSCSCAFNVVQTYAAPSIKSANPANGQPGSSVTTTLTGTGFSKGVNVAFSGTGITVASVTFDAAKPSELTVTATIAPAATPGARDITAKTTDNQSGAICTGCFTVTAGPAPTASPSATPTSSPSPSPTPSSGPVSIGADRGSIIAGQQAFLTVTGTPGATYDVTAANRPSSTFVLAHRGTLGANGTSTFEVHPLNNVNFIAHSGSATSPQVIVSVHTGLNIGVKRSGNGHVLTFYGQIYPNNRTQAIYIKTGNTTVGQATRDASGKNWTFKKDFTSSAGKTLVFYSATASDTQNANGHSINYAVKI
jgi:hypothetical protein